MENSKYCDTCGSKVGKRTEQEWYEIFRDTINKTKTLTTDTKARNSKRD